MTNDWQRAGVSFASMLSMAAGAIYFHLPLDYGAFLLFGMLIAMFLTMAFFLRAVWS